MDKKRVKKYSIIGGISFLGVGLIVYLVHKNGQLKGIIKNQQLTIDGMSKEIKNLSYHLGKKTNLLITKNT